MPKRSSMQEPTLFSREPQVPAKAERVHSNAGAFDIKAFNFFDAAYPSRENIENWGHLQPETIEDITDPDSIRALRIASICEVINDDALNGMIAVGAESLIGTGCQMRVQCGFKNRKYNELEQYIEYLWDDWCRDVQYARLLRTAAKDWMQFGSYFRRIVQNPHKKMGMDVQLVSPLRIQTPYDLQEGDFTFIDGERVRVYNGIAFDEYRNERYFCIAERPAFTNGYYDNAVYEWVSARQMCQVFEPQFSEQITGYPMTAPSLEKGIMRRQYEKDELRAARLGATITGTFKTTSDFRTFFENLQHADQREIIRLLCETYSKAGDSVHITPNDFLNLPPLTEAQPFDTKHPHAGFASHRNESIKGQGRSLRMPEHIATGSSANYNYASVQKDSQFWSLHRACFRLDMELIDLRKAFEMFLSIASVTDPELAPIFQGQVKPVIPTFYWKEEEHADPVKQAVADLLYQRAAILSTSDIMMKLGKDPEKQKAEVKADMDDMKGYSLFDMGTIMPLVQMAQEANEGSKKQ